MTKRTDRFRLIPLEVLRAHPANPNVMDEGLLAKLTENIRRQKDYPPLIVRSHPQEEGAFQIIDGHQRLEALQRLGEKDAHCYVWPCSDADALVLIATLNRLHGEDQPAKRAELLQELTGLFPLEVLAGLLPEDDGEISRSIELLKLDLDAAIKDLTKDAPSSEHLVAVTFALTPKQAEIVESAVSRAMADLIGPNRRGRALTTVAQLFLEEASNG